MDIFDRQKDVVDNLNKSAHNLGYNDVLKEQPMKKVWAPKRSCKKCWGLGKLPGQDVKGKHYDVYCKCLRQIEIPA